MDALRAGRASSKEPGRGRRLFWLFGRARPAEEHEPRPSETTVSVRLLPGLRATCQELLIRRTCCLWLECRRRSPSTRTNSVRRSPHADGDNPARREDREPERADENCGSGPRDARRRWPPEDGEDEGNLSTRAQRHTPQARASERRPAAEEEEQGLASRVHELAYGDTTATAVMCHRR
jgi:hypothetical protein